MDAAYALSLTISVAYLVLNSFFLYYMYDLKTCTCALSWRRNFLIASLFIYIVMSLLSITVLRRRPLPLLSVVIFIWTVLYVIVTRQFINSVKRKDCECAETTTFQVLNVVNIVQMVLLGVLGLWLLALLVLVFIAAGRLKEGPAAAAKTVKRR